MMIRKGRPAGCARLRASVLLIALLAVVFDSARCEVRATVHDRAFWVGLRAAGFKLPQGQATLPLALEAAALLGSTDSELRDAIAYEAIETWVYREQRLDPAELEQLRLAEEHAALWSGAFDPARYGPVRAQLNALNAFAADLDADTVPATGIRSALRSLRSETQ